MAGSVNKAIIVGNVGKQPEIRSTQNGSEIASFSIATSESWKDKNTGERKNKTEWHNISVMNKGLVNVVKQYVNKGDKLYIEGKIQTRSYDKNGTTMYATSVVLSGFDAKLLMLSGNNGNQQNTSQSESYDSAPVDNIDEEVPF